MSGMSRDRGGREARSAWTEMQSLSRLPRELMMERIGYAARQPLFTLPFYPRSLSPSTPTRLAVTVSDPWPGNAEAGRAIIAGRFSFHGETHKDPSPLWRPADTGPRWRAALNDFAWLRNLRAAGGDGARRQARRLVADWIAENAVAWQSLIWNPAIAGRRLCHWLSHFEFFGSSGTVEFRQSLLREIERQALHLERVLPAGLTGAEAIAAIKGLTFAGVCLPERVSWCRRGLELLERELSAQIRVDGGHVQRNPRLHCEVLRDLIDLRALLSAGGLEVPANLETAITQMAPVLRLLTHGDGGLALFNGGDEGNSLHIDMMLQRAAVKGVPMTSAPQSGFQRLQAGRAVVLVDCGPPPPPGFDRHAHAGTLGFEVSIGRERLIVNCGAHLGDGPWSEIQRSTAAHSTLVIDDTNSAELARDGTLRRRPENVFSRREESEGNTWLDCSHDGYRRRLGQIHHRRLFLSANGEDLRGEDRLRGKGGRHFVLRFHLHPDVHVIAGENNSAVLQLPRGGTWRLRAKGAIVGLEDSVYLGSPGKAQPCRQVVLSGEIETPETAVKWGLRHEAP